MTLHAKSGFTLLECIIAIALITILIFLTLLGVHAVREQSRSTQCKNNIRQWSITILQHADLKRSYPSNDERLPQDDGHSLGAYLSLVRMIEGNFERYRKYDPPNLILHNEPFAHPAYAYCPSEFQPGIINYRFNTGSEGKRGFTRRFMEHANGPFVATGPDVRTTRVTDGLSNVASVSERQAIPSGNHETMLRFARTNRNVYSNLTPDDYAPWCDQAGWAKRELQYVALPHGTHFDAIYYSHILGPNSAHKDCYSSNLEWAIDPRSFHSGVVNVGFLDGRVISVCDSITITVWRALGGIDDGTIDPDSMGSE